MKTNISPLVSSHCQLVAALLKRCSMLQVQLQKHSLGLGSSLTNAANHAPIRPMALSIPFFCLEQDTPRPPYIKSAPQTPSR